MSKSFFYLNIFVSYSVISVFMPAIFILTAGYDTLLYFVINEVFSFVYIIIFLIGIVVHECLHYIAFRLLGVNKDDVEFGFSWKKVMPYVKLRVPVKSGVYILSALMPFILLAAVPFTLALYTGRPDIFVFSLLMAKGCAGDIALVTMALKNVKERKLIIDSDGIGFKFKLEKSNY